MRITALYGSPRKDGNTDLLLRAFLEGARQGDARITKLCLRDFRFSFCTECGGCADTGACALRDDMDRIYPHLIAADLVVLSAPVFFYGLNALAKAMVDRTQCFWVRKYLLGRGLRQERGCEGTGVLLSVGGARGKKNFDGIMLTARYFFDALDMPFSHHLTFSGIDEKGAILGHPEACLKASELGRELAKGQA